MVHLNLLFHRTARVAAALAVPFLLVQGCTNDREVLPDIPICDTMQVSYAQDVYPLIQVSCAVSGCHENGYIYGDFTNYQELKDKVDLGVFQTEVFDQKSMPQAPVAPLTGAELQLLECWVEHGALNN
ncbi:MAG: hypothetical protein H6585_00230 [Flavobacteriales bacterium]|nr:hypothetical protein [Flavobacteriales bacterium]MCB9446751.1 hypothetical protein [Flavobacteriales bacterium]